MATQQQQHLQDIIKKINEGNASLGKFYTFTEGEGVYGAQDILSNGEVAFKGGYLPVSGSTQVDRIPGTNNYMISVPTDNKNSIARLTVSVDPNTNKILPVSSVDQLQLIGTGQSGGTFLDKAIESTLGRASDWIDGDPLKAAALFAGGAALAPQLGAAGTTAGATAGGSAGTTGGLMGGAGGITAGSSGVSLTGAGTSAYGGLGAGLGEATAAGGIGGSAFGGVGLTAGTGAAYGGLGAGLGTSAAAMGTGSLLGTGAASSPAAAAAAGAATGAGALTASEAARAALIQGGLGLAGGLLQGNTTQNALEADAAARAALAQKTMEMGKFQPVGTTTRFGTSSFVTDPVTGAITPSYSLSPEALAYQNSLSALGTQGLQGAQTMMNLGQQYVGESPEAVRQRYMSTQNALLAPGNEQALAGIRTNLVNTGRQGLSYGATSDGMMATNPELAAYYNSLANQQRQLAAGAETQYQNQVNFGAGLMGGATTPFTNVFTAQKAVEAAGQQPLAMSTDFANTVATRGAAQGANYAAAMSPSLQSSYNAANYNPWATAIQGASSNPLVGYGLMQAWK